MMEPTRGSVLAPFGGERYETPSEDFVLRTGGDRFLVDVVGPDGVGEALQVAYTFGAEPLQQYLVATERGRLQALPIAWDSRPEPEGGQRWFHLYPGDSIPPGDALHWRGVNQNWNSNCASCHSTALRKVYSADADSFATSFAGADVGCEACHGPGGDHIAWAGEAAPSGDPRLAVRFDPAAPASWVIDPATGTAAPHERSGSDPRIEACAGCHSRRAPLTDGAVPGAPFLDGHAPTLLTAPLYFADGQIRDEVFVWGSFVQSAMYHAGVTCSDCHEPHSARLRAEGNGLCASCHLPARFDTPDHHLHPAGSAGAECVSCHMPERTYMVVDPRRDHSIRVPRPDLAGQTGAPDACTSCHSDLSPSDAAEALAARYPGPRPAHWGSAVALASGHQPGADAALASVVADSAAPGIARGTALSLLADPGAPDAYPALERAIIDPDPLVRLGAVRAAERLDPTRRVALAALGASDEYLAVRIEAGRVYGTIPRASLDPAAVSALVGADGTGRLLEAVEAYRRSLEASAERPESWMNLASLARARGAVAAVESAYQRALELQPSFGPAALNLADLWGEVGRDTEGEALLRDAIALSPRDAGLHHALGLALVRLDRLEEGTAELAMAVELAPREPRFAYVHGIALNSMGDAGGAVSVLVDAHGRAPTDRDILLGLATIERDRGRIPEALEHARTLLALDPSDPAARALVASLGGLPGG